ncbi:MAG TPA: glycine cleavage system protein GcvH [Longimicrobiales bacterium]|nr:glycine cleavage system protein GcvH [Longimicrobiales bacterium]
MSNIPDDLHYTEDHEYLRQNPDGTYSVGITDYAQGELGDIVFVELPGAGDSFQQKDSFGTIEAVKAVSDLYAPVNGEVVEVNEALEDDPGVVNSDPYGDGWMIRIEVADEDQLDELLDAAAYAEHIGE